MILAFDTATPATVVGVARDGELLSERRHDPAPEERPGHAGQLLSLCHEALAQAGASPADVTRIGVGVGPGTFTGMRIGVATARALAQATGAELVAVGTLDALADAARETEGSVPPVSLPVAAVLDARRGEAFVAVYDAAGRRVLGPEAWAPERLGELAAVSLAAGDGAVRFRDRLEAAGIAVPHDDSPLHRVAAGALCRLAAAAVPADRDALVPDYVRAPDATPRR